MTTASERQAHKELREAIASEHEGGEERQENDVADAAIESTAPAPPADRAEPKRDASEPSSAAAPGEALIALTKKLGGVLYVARDGRLEQVAGPPKPFGPMTSGVLGPGDSFYASWQLSPKLTAAVRREMSERAGLPDSSAAAPDAEKRDVVAEIVAFVRDETDDDTSKWWIADEIEKRWGALAKVHALRMDAALVAAERLAQQVLTLDHKPSIGSTELARAFLEILRWARS